MRPYDETRGRGEVRQCDRGRPVPRTQDRHTDRYRTDRRDSGRARDTSDEYGRKGRGGCLVGLTPLGRTGGRPTVVPHV